MKRTIFALLLAVCAGASAQTFTGTVSSGTICGSQSTSPNCANIPFTILVQPETGAAELVDGTVSITQVSGKWFLQFGGHGAGLGLATITSPVPFPLPTTGSSLSAPSASVTFSFSGVNQYRGTLKLSYKSFASPTTGLRWIVTGGTITLSPPLVANPQHPSGGCYDNYFSVQFVQQAWLGPDWYFGVVVWNTCTWRAEGFVPWFTVG